MTSPGSETPEEPASDIETCEGALLDATRNRTRIAVIGAGVIGLKVAWRLAGLGADVTVSEAGRPGSETTSTSFAWLNASSKVDAREGSFRLNALTLAKPRAVGLASGAAGWFRPPEGIELADL